MRKKIELLAPAGNKEIFKAAVDAGADAVYCGIDLYNARMNASNLTMDDLADYPCLIFEQDNNSSFYFYEETIMSEFRYQNVIKTYDRATQLDLIRQLDAYSIGTGKVSDLMKRFGLKIIPLDSEERIFVGYITRRGTKLSDAGDAFITRIKEYF